MVHAFPGDVLAIIKSSKLNTLKSANESDVSLYQLPDFTKRMYYSKMADLIFKEDPNPEEYELLDQENEMTDQPLLRGNTFKNS